ncbi:5-formyltetrahydrofolate cyclo-ligase [Sphingopyxis sp. BSNA05]|uniref:5-formyltetrahydrofolate cyclo-ligase n=1 Tax=Sphingomonadales TaxID=204457 RepID=UPI000C1EE585|nr:MULTISPECIES: 5-formyltetrahydrofolate cyclo-ligase [Sphingomonadaceae]ATW05044.1 5-formyltetrahydrofolate cyclo-ligase [Sphingorhabdus sp. YGSMI21]NRD88812.1 5-formyltetrahydrofolate cyclo-ligase [Sphingopyxis sp. BSNA05]
MSSLKEKKQKLRKEYRRRRDSFVGQLDGASRNLSFRRPPSPLARLLAPGKTIAFYRSVGSEAPTERLVEYLTETGVNIAFPRVMDSGALEFRMVTGPELLECGFRDIPEPDDSCPLVDPDVIIAPLVAFDRSLRRLGQGGGYYDRSFARYPDIPRIGLAWSVQEADEIPTEAHDLPLQMIVTECEIIE